MIDDSDDLSDGEFRFYFFLNDKRVDGEKQTIDIPLVGKKTFTPKHIFKEIGSGKKFKVDWLGLVENVDQVKISVSGIDNDDDPDLFFSTLQSGGTAPPTKPLGTASTGLAEWATGSITVKTPNPPTDKAVRQMVEIDVNGHKKDVDVRFKVKAEVLVTFG